jgi:hypothetical protein
MSYDEAIAEVRSGKYAWRQVWNDSAYLYLNGNEIFIMREGVGVPYTPTGQDTTATDWDGGDKPPKR